MGWIAAAGLALVTGAILWWFARRETAAVQLVGAALLIALAGYVWQGRPGLAGAPKATGSGGPVLESGFAALRQDLLGRFDRASSWLTMAEGYQRRGDTLGGVQIIGSGLRQSPRDPDLWVGLGYALLLHADGVMTPAAEMAFRRAAAIAPEHPAPGFFYGLALAQGGRLEQAESVWQRVLAELPEEEGDKWRQATEQRLALIAEIRRQALQQPPGGPRRP